MPGHSLGLQTKTLGQDMDMSATSWPGRSSTLVGPQSHTLRGDRTHRGCGPPARDPILVSNLKVASPTKRLGARRRQSYAQIPTSGSTVRVIQVEEAWNPVRIRRLCVAVRYCARNVSSDRFTEVVQPHAGFARSTQNTIPRSIRY